jgi:osmoprotectant transport system ATP-binding protein
MSGSKFLFELNGVSKSYDSHTALERTELRIPTGKTTALIGESGSGKSTLLRLMLGLVRPDTGQVRFDGAELAPQNVLALRRRMGYGIQGGGLFPHLTAGGNVSLMARYLRWPQGRIDARLAELVELTQFPKDGLDRFPHELSGGQAQRVSLMRALMLGPEALLLDEPLGALDPVTRYELQADLKAVFEKLGKTVVLVTHDIGEAAFFGHLLAVLRRGRIVQQGTIEELVRSPADPYVTRFIRAQRHPMDSVSPQAR